MKAAFSPVGVFIDWFDLTAKPNQKIELPIIIFNDLNKEWNGNLRMKLISDDKIINESDNIEVNVKPYLSTNKIVTLDLPDQKRRYEIIAEIIYNNEVVFSTRKFEIK